MNKEKLLPQIKLKYFGRGKSKPITQGVWCFVCHKKNIIIGSADIKDKENPKYICEDCSIEFFRQENGFKSKSTAASYRRRMFDVLYLFQEIVLDKMVEDKIIGNTDLSFENLQLFQSWANQAYNELFLKEEKEELETIESQNEIEKVLNKAILNIKLPKFT